MSQITAKVIAHSKSATDGQEIVTFELTYHRYIHSELMTHRMFSRNAMSSRAVPIKKMLEQVANDPAMPTSWGKNQAGMQAKEEFTGVHATACELLWKQAAKAAVKQAEELEKKGLHKQLVNRLGEPFQLMKTVVTATEFDNFFYLRRHSDAQPEIKLLADKMWEALQNSEPLVLQAGEWHLPYVKTMRMPSYAGWNNELVYTLNYTEFADDSATWNACDLEVAKKVSASCCAQVSYRTNDTSVEKALKIYDALVESKPVHGSPFEHQATPMAYIEFMDLENTWPEGITSMDSSGKHWSGNFKGWVQYRQLIKDNACWEYSDAG